MQAYQLALSAFLNDPASADWRDLPFFSDGDAVRIASELDARLSAGTQVLPAPADIFNAFRLTPLRAVKVVILGQDPYPTPGHAHGLAFSCLGLKLPASLKRIYRELGDDLGISPPVSGDLSGWAREGVLLLNAALSVEAGQAGSHLKLGWDRLANETIAAVSEAAPAAVFILWGDKARARRQLIAPRHLVIESAHPSPLAARGNFLGSRPFSRANAFLMAKGIGAVRWA
ncbi:MAG: uracil-DNA glycosylase [Bosea sp. (in: a-proteobacteria)]